MSKTVMFDNWKQQQQQLVESANHINLYSSCIQFVEYVIIIFNKSQTTPKNVLVQICSLLLGEKHKTNKKQRIRNVLFL